MKSMVLSILLTLFSFSLFGMDAIVLSDEQLMELETSTLKDLVKRCQKIVDLRAKQRGDSRLASWNQFLKEKFPETQMGGKLEVMDFYKMNLETNRFTLRLLFTPSAKITSIKAREVPYRVSLEFSTWEGYLDSDGNTPMEKSYKFVFDFNGHENCTSNSDLWFTYENRDYKNKITEGPLTPYACNQGRCNKFLPNEVLSLPWVSALIYNYEKLFDLLSKMPNPRTNQDSY